MVATEQMNHIFGNELLQNKGKCWTKATSGMPRRRPWGVTNRATGAVELTQPPRSSIHHPTSPGAGQPLIALEGVQDAHRQGTSTENKGNDGYRHGKPVVLDPVPGQAQA